MREARVVLADEAAVIEAGRAIARSAEAGTSIFLSGELGAGKTTFTRGIARALGHDGAVKSPTYTLVEPYRNLRLPFYHFDLYRLGDPEEIEFMGIRDYFTADALLVLEWPEKAEAFLPQPDLHVMINVLGESREFVLQAHSDKGVRCMEALLD